MKRSSILFSLIAFVTVSCAGPSKVEWTKRNFRPDQFEKDREECIQTLNNNLYSYSKTSGLVDDCLARKGYQYQPRFEPSYVKQAEEADKTITTETVVKVLLGIVLVPTVFILGGLANDQKATEDIIRFISSK